MADFDPNAFIADSSSASAPIQSPGTAPAAASPPPAGFDPERFVNDGAASDHLMGEQIPLALSGNSPETAMNKSPLSTYDRMKLSLGNPAGNVKYLQGKYADVKPINGPDGKPSKDLAVRDGNTWFRVNPVNGDIADPWERTKEYMTDAATFAPEALGIGVAGATDFLTAGASLPESAAIAGGVTAGLRTSLGRAVGTYDATPLEQAWDIGFESLLNAGGAKILAGVKPTAKFVANRLDGLAEAFKDTVEPWIPSAAKSAAKGVQDVGAAMASAPKMAMKKILSAYSVGENNFDTMLENTQQVKGVMNNLYDKAGSNVNAYHDEALRQQTSSIKNIAENTRSTLSNIYGSMRNKILADVPAGFSVNLEDPVYQTYSQAIQNGLGKLMAGGKELEGTQALEYMAKNGMKNTGFRMYSQDELAGQIAKGASLGNGVGALAADKEAYNTMNEFYNNLGRFTGGQNRTGTEGAKALLDFKKVAGDLSYKMANTEAAQSTPELRRLLDQAKTSMDDSIFQSLKEHGLGDQFLKLNKTYSDLSENFQPLLQAHSQYLKTNNPKVYEGLLNTFLSRPGKTASARFAIDDAIQAADSNGLNSLAQSLINDKRKIQVVEAAKAFNPIKSGTLKADSISAGQLGIGAYLAATHDPKAMAALAGMQALRSPKTASLGIAVTQGLAKGQQVLSQMTKGQAEKFLSNPEAINAFTTGVTSAPLVRAQAEQQMQGIMQQMQQGPQQ